MPHPTTADFAPTELLHRPSTGNASSRRTPRASDNALNGTARIWLRRLPERRRPLRLCEHYPRVANRIAFCWPEAGMASAVLEDLLVDKRGNRRGFPSSVQRELRRLAEYNDQQRVESTPETWLDTLRRLAGAA
jgi:hypothetical protein